jgi:DNA-binding protein YbaB
MTEVRDQVSDLTGQGQTPDGRVKVLSTSSDPLAEIHIDPRAMRMGSEDLAAAIKTAFDLSRADLEHQVQKITAQAYGDGDNPMEMLKNKDQLKETMGEVQGIFGQAGRDAQSLIDDLHRKLGLSKSPENSR